MKEEWITFHRDKTGKVVKVTRRGDITPDTSSLDSKIKAFERDKRKKKREHRKKQLKKAGKTTAKTLKKIGRSMNKGLDYLEKTDLGKQVRGSQSSKKKKNDEYDPFNPTGIQWR